MARLAADTLLNSSLYPVSRFVTVYTFMVVVFLLLEFALPERTHRFALSALKVKRKRAFFVNLVHFLHFIKKKACKTQRWEAEYVHCVKSVVFLLVSAGGGVTPPAFLWSYG